MKEQLNDPTPTVEQLKKELEETKHAYTLLKTKSEKDFFDQSQAIHVLQESENRNRNLFYNAPVNYHSLDTNGCIVIANPEWLNSLGYTQEEVAGHSFSEFISPEYSGLFESEWLPSLLEAGQIHYVEFEMLRKDGTRLFVSLDGKVGYDAKGQIEQTHFILTDITRRKKAERLQSENENSYRELFNNVADAIYIQDVEGTFLDVNEGAVKMYGYSREELIGKSPLFVSAPGKNDLKAVARIIRLAYEGEPQQFEFWGIRANGEIFPKEVRVVNGTYFGKKVNIAMAQDITERKQAEIALQESEKRFRELIELAVDGIMIGSPEGNILEANSYMQYLTGRSIENLVGVNISELFRDNSLKNKPLRYDLLKKGETVFGERDILRPDGKIVPIEMHTKMMPNGTYQSIYRDVTERKRAEEVLRESETKFKMLVESTSDLIWETDLDGKYIYVSPQFENLLGYHPHEVLGKSPFEFIFHENISEIISQSNTIVQHARPFSSLVNKYIHRDGHYLYFETSGVPVFNNEGKHVGSRGISRDITKRRIDEKELHKLSSVVQQNPNTIIITNLKGEIEYINPAGCTISGYNLNELIGRKPSVFSSGNTPKETYKSLWTTLLAGKKWKGIFHNRNKNGELYWESALIIPLRDSDGAVSQYLGVKEDITKRIQAEEALKESEERYRQLFEASPDAIILANIESGMLIDANPVACSLLGYALDEIKGMHHTTIHPARFREFAIAAFTIHAQKALNKEQPQPAESVIRRSDGTEVSVEVLANYITLNGQNILQGVFRDITERLQVRDEIMKAKEKAETSDKLKSAFLRNISHELRTPLNGIIGFSEMITQMDNSEEDRIEFNKMIKKSSARLINTITGYMDISLIVSGLTQVNKQPFNLQEYLKKITSQIKATCNANDVQLNIISNVPVEEIEMITDEDLLSKVFSQLIDNAVKFTKSGSITVGYELKPGFHKFFISDTGAGISSEHLDLIFEIFRQADLSTTRNYEGSGLGLSIARGFLKLLGGEIWVESEINEGSTFFFTIPAEEQGITETYTEGNMLQPILPIVLIAEDDDSNYKYLEILLKKASFKVLRARNGLETLDICQHHPEINIVITDMKMPDMDGLESTRQIRAKMPDLPIIGLSGLISSHDENAARSAGCNDYIIKPISKSKLLDTINKLLYPTMY